MASPRHWLLAPLFFLTIAPLARAEDPTLNDLERQFRALPMDARRLTGPLFWLHGDESAQKLEAELVKVAEGGNGTFTAESRPHRDWMGPTWYRDLDICLRAAKKLDLTMWIFDEKWWPSGEVGGKVPAQYGASGWRRRSRSKSSGPKRIEWNSVAAAESRRRARRPARRADGHRRHQPDRPDANAPATGGSTVDLRLASWTLMLFTWEH